MAKYNKETFEQFLGRRHMQDEPMTLDDDLPDAFDAWLTNTKVDTIIQLAEIWHIEQLMTN